LKSKFGISGSRGCVEEGLILLQCDISIVTITCVSEEFGATGYSFLGRLVAFMAFIQVANVLKLLGIVEVEPCRYQICRCTFQSEETRGLVGLQVHNHTNE
jgi:hypothetical protein